tara:strand:+ start:196 stop:342 length:147 start_codon:yes stop_codon:yes gene_type:complete
MFLLTVFIYNDAGLFKMVAWDLKFFIKIEFPPVMEGILFGFNPNKYGS